MAPRRRGRPSIEEGEQSVKINLRLGPSLYDRLARTALRRGPTVSVGDVIREHLERLQEQKRSDDDDGDPLVFV
jgi:Arc/MetJ-type ribon-helix-helix transcriptional regulator